MSVRKSFLLRLEDKIFSKIKRVAETQDKSLNALCLELIESGLSSVASKSNPAIEILKSHFGKNLRGVVLFGSVARHTDRPSSDIDYLIVLSDEIPLQGKLYRQWDELMDHVEFEKISPHFVHLNRDLKNAGSLWLEVCVEGKILLDQNGDVESKLCDLRRHIADGRYERSYVYGVPYWKKVA